MRKRCPECQTTTSAQAVHCTACGCQFVNTPPVIVHEATWKGRVVAIACGLVAAVIMQSLRG